MEKIALTERSQQLIKNYLLGGAALGGSAALATSLVNYMKMLKADAAPKDTSNDDDTLYVNVPGAPPKVAATTPNNNPGMSDLSAGGLALTGGTLGALGSYALVRKLYQNMKKKQLQEQLDKAQQTFLTDAQNEAAMKNAAAMATQGHPMGLGEFISSSPVAFTLLSALAAGALTNTALDKTFPAVKKNNNPAPKKVVLRRQPQPPAEDEVIPDQEKIASDNDNGLELLVGLAMHNIKAASKSELADIVHAVAGGRHNELVHNLMEHGFDMAMSSIKGASEDKISEPHKCLAISICVKSAALNPVVTMLAAAEYTDMAPRLTKTAALQSDEDKDILVKIANILGAVNRHAVFYSNPDFLSFAADKAAATTPQGQQPNMSIEDIMMLINQLKQNPAGGEAPLNLGQGQDEHIEGNDGDITSEDSLSSSEEKKTNDLHPGAPHGSALTSPQAPDFINALGEDDDLIDAAMSQPTLPAKAIAADHQ
jgi:hypothetical protein